MSEKNVLTLKRIQDRIFTIRGNQVMIDADLAELYQVETKVFNQAVKRNIERFPESFRFQLTDEEFDNLRSQIVTSRWGQNWGGRRYNPYAFTEQGTAMLSAVLKSDVAVNISIQIMKAFVAMRKFINNNTLLIQRVENVEKKQIETDGKVEKLLSAFETNDVQLKQGISKKNMLVFVIYK